MNPVKVTHEGKTFEADVLIAIGRLPEIISITTQNEPHLKEMDLFRVVDTDESGNPSEIEPLLNCQIKQGGAAHITFDVAYLFMRHLADYQVMSRLFQLLESMAQKMRDSHD